MSKDTIYREDAIKALGNEPMVWTLEDEYTMGQRSQWRADVTAIESIPSADRPQDDTVSRQYLLAEIDDLADEFSELDENGLHSERWCGIMDSRGVIVNTPSVSDRLQGEWVLDPNGMDWNIPAWRCSRCGFVANYIGTEANGFGRNPMNWAGSKYCPNCGAKMEVAYDEY